MSLDGPQASHTDGGNHNGNTTNGTGNGRSGVFMNGTEAEASKSVKQASILLPDVPVVAHELCRETLGVRLEAPLPALCRGPDCCTSPTTQVV